MVAAPSQRDFCAIGLSCPRPPHLPPVGQAIRQQSSGSQSSQLYSSRHSSSGGRSSDHAGPHSLLGGDALPWTLGIAATVAARGWRQGSRAGGSSGSSASTAGRGSAAVLAGAVEARRNGARRKQQSRRWSTPTQLSTLSLQTIRERSWLSLLSFKWVKPLLRKGNSEDPIVLDDVMPPPHGLQAAALAEEFRDDVKGKGYGADRKIPVLKTVLWIHRFRLLRTGLLRLLNTCIQFLPVLCLNGLLKAIERGDPYTGLRSAVLLFLVLCSKTVVENQLFYFITKDAIRVRAMLQASIYSKSLKLPESAAAVPPVTLMQVDSGKLESLFYSVHTLWDGILQVLGYSFLLVRYLGPAGLSGLVVLAVLLPLNARLNRQLSRLSREAFRCSDARVSTTSELLRGIRAIRQMGWEEVFNKEVCELREEELSAQRRRMNVGATLVSVFSALPPFMTAVVLAAYAWTQGGQAFQPSTIFAALAVLDQVRFPLLFYPSALDQLAEGKTASSRIADFLALEEASSATQQKKQDHGDGSAPPSAGGMAALSIPAGRYQVGGVGSPTLVLPHQIDIEPKELVAVVGAVGAGKSTLLQALIGELPQAKLGAPSGTVAYCAQQPWVPTGTLQNVVTGDAVNVDEKSFKKACKAAGIDFAQPQDEITLGTLSGGQQARVALARAVYTALADPQGDLHSVVLDDITAALDPRVSTQVLKNCVVGAMAGLTRIVATNDSGASLRIYDKIIIMDSIGQELRVVAQGSYTELAMKGLLDAEALHHGEDQQEEHAEAAAAAAAGAVEVLDQAEAEETTSSVVKLTVAEDRAKGNIPGSLYRRYFTTARSPVILTLALASIVACYVATLLQQWFVGLWSADTTLRRGLPFYLIGVTSLGTAAAILGFGRALFIAAFGRRSSRAIHKDLCNSVLVRASTRYFDANPQGRVLQRFAKDLEQVDSALPSSLRNMLACMCTLSGSMANIVLVSPPFVFVLMPLAWVYWKALGYYLPVAREMKRLEALARSPVYTEQGIAADGVVSIRQLRLEERMKARALAAIDGSTSVTYAMKGVDRWFSFRMELLGNVVVLSSGVLGLLATGLVGPTSWGAAKIAVSVTQALSVTGLLNWTVRTVADTETSFSSFQRVVFTTDETELEAPRKLPADSKLVETWPASGQVELQDVSLRYRDDLPLVLNDVSFKVSPGQRVGIVGRTGSGKSTVLRVLLRTVELEDGSGTVSVDDTDIKSIGLERLRRGVTVIPQDNFLLTGTVRRNVDPEGVYTDAEVRRALEAASLNHWDLSRSISASKGDISPGERQLLGVARAVLRGSHVMAFDEVTSRVDEATDRKVQEALRRLPEGTTLLVVSHRISTLEDYDMVIVMDKGKVAEVGDPQTLKRTPGSIFAQLSEAESIGARSLTPAR